MEGLLTVYSNGVYISPVRLLDRGEENVELGVHTYQFGGSGNNQNITLTNLP